MSLRENLDNELKSAMKTGDKLKVSVLRLIRSEIKYVEIDKSSPLSDEELMQLITRQSKRRKESIEQFTKGNRSDLAEKETAELQIISQYLPEQLDEEEVVAIVQEVILELQAKTKSDKGRVMSALMPRMRGKADGKMVSRVVDTILE